MADVHHDPERAEAEQPLTEQPVCVLSLILNLVSLCRTEMVVADSLLDCRPTRSIYALTRSEISRGVANRFVHSRSYIFLYLAMAALSVATVVLSLKDGCPGLAFYVLEIIINVSMIAEVGIRFIAFGRVGLRPFVPPSGRQVSVGQGRGYRLYHDMMLTHDHYVFLCSNSGSLRSMWST